MRGISIVIALVLTLVLTGFGGVTMVDRPVFGLGLFISGGVMAVILGCLSFAEGARPLRQLKVDRVYRAEAVLPHDKLMVRLAVSWVTHHGQREYRIAELPRHRVYGELKTGDRIEVHAHSGSIYEAPGPRYEPIRMGGTAA